MRAAIIAESLVLGLVVTLVVCVRPPGVFMRPPHLRTNYRERPVAGTLGIVLLLPLFLGGVVALVDDAPSDAVAAVVGSGALLGVVGLIDDVYGDRRAGGLIGHARALLRGRVTTGTLKAAAGVVVGIVAAWIVGLHGVSILIGGAVVALGAHLANLLDVRPGRTLKVWLPTFVALAVVAGLTGAVLATAALAGGAAGFAYTDLRERAMLGDAGAAILGGSLGAAAVASLDQTQIGWTALVLAALTLAAEVVSFTRVIERVAPLRFLDGFGRAEVTNPARPDRLHGGLDAPDAGREVKGSPE